MRSDSFLRRSAIVTTTGQLPRISIDEILAVQIDLPPNVEEQKRIVNELYARLAHVESLIANCQDEVESIDSLPAVLLGTAFEQGHCTDG